jgi:hypothetical protein
LFLIVSRRVSEVAWMDDRNWEGVTIGRKFIAYDV